MADMAGGGAGGGGEGEEEREGEREGEVVCAGVDKLGWWWQGWEGP